MPPKRKRNSAAAEADVDSPAPARKKKAARTSSANDNDSAPDALALLTRARAAIQESKESSPKLLQLVAALRALVAQDGPGPTVRLPRAAQADSDAVRLLRDAVLALRSAGAGSDVSAGVRTAVGEIQLLVEPPVPADAPKANGSTTKTKTKAKTKPALASASASSTAVSVVPPAAKAVKVVADDGTPPPEYTLDDDQDMPNNALDPDADYGWDSDEFTLLDHLTSFIDNDGGSSSGSSDFAADYGPGDDDPWSGDEDDDYYSE